MNLYLAFIIVAALWGATMPSRGCFNRNYLSKEQTTCVNGIFILVVFYSHLVNDYIAVDMVKDGLMQNVKVWLGQLMVTTFLFYSGYGVCKQCLTRFGYADTILKKRIPTVWLQYAIAVVIYAIIQYFRGNTYTLGRYLQAFAAWKGIGQSTWYIFCILIHYFATWYGMTLFKGRPIGAIITVWVCTILYMLAMAKLSNDYTYNTALCYPLGMLICFYQDKLEAFLFEKKRYLLSLCSVLVAFLILRSYSRESSWYYAIHAMLFVFLVVLLTMKINLRSPILLFFGKHLFWIYILHRIPMQLLKDTGYASQHAYRTAAISFVITVVAAVVLNTLFQKLSQFIWKRKKNHV